jgi:hypothetical protein
MASIHIETAIDVFVESFSFVHNLTQPCEVIHSGSLRIIKDMPEQGKVLREEIVAPLDVAPGEVVARVSTYQPAAEHMLDVFQRPGESLDPLSAAYGQHGYHHSGYEPLMAIELPAVFTPGQPHIVHRVRTQAQANLVTKNARQKLIKPEHLHEPSPPVRLYYIEEAGKVIAWGRSTQQRQSVACVAGMSTNKAYRRRGLASAILSQILVDDAAQGASYSVLMASRMGFALYRKCGY